MKILLFSDSHGYTQRMLKAIHKNKSIDMVIHLGDYVGDALKLKEACAGFRFEFVRGNNDWTREVPSEKILYLEGKRIFITHGHEYNVKYDYQRIIARGKSEGADAVFFGHTHLAEEMFSDHMLVLNPGSIGLPIRGNKPTYCIIEIRNQKIIPRFEAL